MFPRLQGRQRPSVFVDSPLGLEITRIDAGLSAYWDDEALDLKGSGVAFELISYDVL